MRRPLLHGGNCRRAEDNDGKRKGRKKGIRVLCILDWFRLHKEFYKLFPMVRNTTIKAHQVMSQTIKEIITGRKN